MSQKSNRYEVTPGALPDVRYETVPYGETDERFPGVARGANGESPGEKMREEIKAQYRVSRSTNREESIQRLLDEMAAAFTTEYPSREDTDVRHYLPSYFATLRDRYGYSFDNQRATYGTWDKLRLVKSYVDHFDMSMIPFKRQRAAEYVQPLLNPNQAQDPLNVLRDLFRDRSKK